LLALVYKQSNCSPLLLSSFLRCSLGDICKGIERNARGEERRGEERRGRGVYLENARSFLLLLQARKEGRKEGRKEPGPRAQPSAVSFRIIGHTDTEHYRA
jgi:hypothetical protein